MVTSLHEASHRIFQDHPEILSEALRLLDVVLPTKPDIEVITPDATEIRPVERRVDSVLQVTCSDGRRFLLAVESQGRRADEKASAWMYYVAFLRERFGVPALLLVVCQDKATQAWAMGPFASGHDGWDALTLRPLVLGPGNVPLFREPQEAARNLALASFAAMTHSRGPDAELVLEALAKALGSADREHLKYYGQMVEIGLADSPARGTWRKMMSMTDYFPGRNTLWNEAEAEGEAKGEAKSVLLLLELQKVTVPDDVRERILACTDHDTLHRWIAAARTATDAADLFAETDAAADGADTADVSGDVTGDAVRRTAAGQG